MIAAALAYYALPPAAPSWLVVLAALAAAGGWLGSYRLARRLAAQPQPGKSRLVGHARRAALIAGRMVLGLLAVWLAFQVLGRIFVLATNWPIWPVALVAAGAAEALVWLYALERRTVPRRTGMALTALRLGLLALLMLMFIQPVLVSVWSQTRKRTLAVLVDASASMRISDRQLPAHEKLRLAEQFSVPAARRPYRLEHNAEDLRAIRSGLVNELAWLDRLAQGKKETLRAQLSQRRKQLHREFGSAGDRLAKQAEAIQALLDEFTQLPQKLQADLLNAKAALNTQVRPRLLEAAGWTHEEQASRLEDNFDRLREGLHRLVGELAKAAPALEAVGEELDKALYAQLSPAERAQVDAVAELSRLELAKATLLDPPQQPGKDQPGKDLLATLNEQYNVKLYTFAGALAEADAQTWSDPIPAALAKANQAVPATQPSQTGQPGKAGADEKFADSSDPAQRTELARAIQEALARAGEEDLAGVVLLSEGQDNGQASAEPLARQMGGQGAAFCAVLMASEKPPPDAAIISLEAPDTVYLADRMFIDAELKLDGLNGKEVRVSLYDGTRPVDFKTIRVAGNIFRTRIQLADEPKKVGLHPYRVEIEPMEGEVFQANNAYPLTLSVTDDKTKVLLIDSRPRWEFRYLKNLFSGRDKTVLLQYVLTQPDRFHGQPERPKVHASVKRGPGQEEATLLPEEEAEWLKFDVILLGDVAAGDLSAEQMRSLRRFVADRGGTLILIAGPKAMPEAFAATPLVDLIPVRLPGGGQAQPGKTSPPAPPVPAGGFRIALTAEGKDHVICRQDVEPEKSLKIWESIPPIFWRSSYSQATPSATVLAYALDANAPQWLTAVPSGATSLPEDLTKKREEYQRKHALLAVAPHGLGKVMLLTFDRSWRLRYRVGDTYHHKFWGQVLRWATAGKLPAGTHLVKLGTDQTRYAPGSRPVARAKIVREDFSPVVTEQVAIKVLDGEKLVGRVPMKYVKDSPGLYTATLDELPAGTYRLELDCPEAQALLKKDGAEALFTEISVDPSAPAEQIELAANRDLLGRLAGLSHNGVVVPPYQARRVLEYLPAGKVQQKHRRQFLLWDSWLLLGLFCGLATTEWLLRKRVGLA